MVKKYKIYKVEYGDTYKLVQWVFPLNKNMFEWHGGANQLFTSYLKSIDSYDRNPFMFMRLWHDNSVEFVADYITKWVDTLKECSEKEFCMGWTMAFLPMKLSDMKILDEKEIVTSDFYEVIAEMRSLDGLKKNK